jgi:hypothetical protein
LQTSFEFGGEANAIRMAQRSISTCAMLCRRLWAEISNNVGAKYKQTNDIHGNLALIGCIGLAGSAPTTISLFCLSAVGDIGRRHAIIGRIQEVLISTQLPF